MTAEEVRRHIHYSGWASRKLLDAARQLPAADLHRPNGISHGSIAGTLSHIYLADRIWYERMTVSTAPVVWDATLADTEIEWPEIQRKWETWSAAQTDAGLDQVIRYRLLNGTPGETPVSLIVMHVVNHATLHRGQVAGMIRQLGIQPPPTDMIYYFRELAAPKM